MINSLSTYAKINKYGFIESPYKRVKEGVVQDKVEYLSAMEETKFTIAQANTKIDKNGKIIEELVSCRQNLNFLLAIQCIFCLLSHQCSLLCEIQDFPSEYRF